MGSGSTTFPLVQQGSFVPVAGTSGIRYKRISLQRNNSNQDVTASGDSSRVFIQGVPILGVSAAGYVGTAATTYGLAEASTITIGTIKIQATVWRLRKFWALQNVTNSSDAEWLWYRPVVSLEAQGVATTSVGPLSSTQSTSTMTTAINGFGTITASGLFKINTFGMQADLQNGGGVVCSFSGQYSAGVGYTAGLGGDFAWLFPSPDNPVKGNLTMNTGGETITNSALFHDVTFSNPAVRGGEISVQSQMRFDKA